MATQWKYIVGTEVTIPAIDGGPQLGRGFNIDNYIPEVPIYYRDTRDDLDEGGYSNIFTSSSSPYSATKYDTFEEAWAWKEEFIPEAIIYRIIG